MKGDHLFSAKCSELGMDCEYIAQGKTIAEVKRMMIRHAAQDHTQELSGISASEIAGLDQCLAVVIS